MDPSIPAELSYYNIDSYEFTLPCIEDQHSEAPLTFFPGEEDKKDVVAINSSQYLSGANYFNYDLPVAAYGLEFTVTNEDLTNTTTTPEFEPSTNTWSILQASCVVDPADTAVVQGRRIFGTPYLPIGSPIAPTPSGLTYYSYEDLKTLNSVNVQMRGHTLNDQKTVFFKLNPEFGYYVNNYYPNSTDIYSNTITVPYANHVPPNFDYSLVNSVDATIFVMSPHESLLGTEITFTNTSATPGANFVISVPNIDTINQNFNFVVTAQYKDTAGDVIQTVAFRVHLEPSFGGP